MRSLLRIIRPITYASTQRIGPMLFLRTSRQCTIIYSLISKYYLKDSESSFKSKIQDFLTRKKRPRTKDDFWAIVSWAFVGHGAFILVGTTTFASIVLLVANSLQIQGKSHS